MWFQLGFSLLGELGAYSANLSRTLNGRAKDALLKQRKMVGDNQNNHFQKVNCHCGNQF